MIRCLILFIIIMVCYASTAAAQGLLAQYFIRIVLHSQTPQNTRCVSPIYADLQKDCSLAIMAEQAGCHIVDRLQWT